ncbi:MAG: hypothetical protein HRT74_06770 [Flavobacteriales bacterium]|nr:hypothetical protein [Flavobacteriales bacterium]
MDDDKVLDMPDKPEWKPHSAWNAVRFMGIVCVVIAMLIKNSTNLLWKVLLLAGLAAMITWSVNMLFNSKKQSPVTIAYLIGKLFLWGFISLLFFDLTKWSWYMVGGACICFVAGIILTFVKRN